MGRNQDVNQQEPLLINSMTISRSERKNWVELWTTDMVFCYFYMFAPAKVNLEMR